MARGRVDTGVRNSIRTVVGYAGLALAGLIAISSAGIDLSSFALVAGGLSLGIGFGLQNVVSNFVSGLILLAERPFKAGDWIVAGDVSGTVKKISVRATEIETFQRQSVILPNSQLINSAVGNWTHRNKLGRVDIKVGVAYGTDVKRAHAVLLDIAQKPSAGAEESRAVRAVRQFRACGARIRDPRLPCRCAQRQHRSRTTSASRCSTPSSAKASKSRRRRAPTRRKPRRTVADRRRKGRGRPHRAEGPGGSGCLPSRRPRSAGAGAKARSGLGLPLPVPNCGMNVAFSCRSDTISYKVAEKGGSPATEAVGTTGTEMLKTFVATFAVLAAAASAQAASAVNLDKRAAHADRHRRRQQVRTCARRRRNRRLLPERLLRHHAQWRHRSADRRRDGRDLRRRRPHQVSCRQ